MRERERSIEGGMRSCLVIETRRDYLSSSNCAINSSPYTAPYTNKVERRL